MSAAVSLVPSWVEIPGFELTAVVGCGGSGVVVEARRRGGDGRRLALKVLRSELALSERERARFLEEARRMRRVEHRGLVGLLDVGVLPGGAPFLVMPLVPGKTVAQRLERGPLPADVAAQVFAVLARAVEAIHRAGMVHRDIKPENIVLAGDDDEGPLHPVLLDFGIARDRGDGASTTTADGRIRGTPAYMAPERFFGAPANVASDVYELGVVLYMMLVGRLPWGIDKDVTQRLNPPDPCDAARGVSRELAAVVLRSLSTRPEVRPPSADAFAREVERCFEQPSGAPSSERSTEVLEGKAPSVATAAAPRGRRLARPLAIAGAVAAIAAAASVALPRGGHAATAPNAAASAAQTAPDVLPRVTAVATAPAIETTPPSLSATLLGPQVTSARPHSPRRAASPLPGAVASTSAHPTPSAPAPTVSAERYFWYRL